MKALHLITTGVLLILFTMRQEHVPPAAKETLKRFLPNIVAATVTDIDFAALHARGIRFIAVDIDNTLVTHGGMTLDESTIAYFRKQRDAGSIEKLAIATNRSKKKLGTLAAQMHADIIVHASGLRRKPFASYYRMLLSAFGCRSDEAAMIGDKVLQDVYGANRASITSILVEPIGPALWFERILARTVRRKFIRK